MEIELKFVGKMAPDFTGVFGDIYLHSIEQFYTVINKKDEVRYRTDENGFTKTIKTGSGLSRQEVETPVSEDEWDDAKKHIIGNYIEKERMKIPFGDLVIEVDVYSRPIFGWYAIIEIEFPDEEMAKSFSVDDMPECIKLAFTEIINVTDDDRFKNRNIALNGFPVM